MVQVMAREAEHVEARFELVPIDRIRPAADNPRRDVGDVAELAASIREHGLLQPLLLADGGESGTYTLVAGHRRLAACQLLGMIEVPATVRCFDDEHRVAAAAVENVQRVDLSATEEAAAYQMLLGLGVPAEEVSQRVGRSARHVTGRLSLLTLPEEVRASIDTGGLALGDAMLLTELADAPEYLAAALEKSRRYGWTVSQAVQAECHRRELDEKCAAAEATLREKGVRVIDPPPNEGIGGQSAVRPLGKGYGQLDVPRSRHAKQACHAAFIRPYRGDVVYVCTEPSRHGVEMPAARDVKAERVAKRAANRARRETNARRRAEARDLVASGADLAAASTHALRMFLASPEEDAARIACDLLGIGVPERSYGEARAALHRLIDGDASAVPKAAFALALGTGEAAASKDFPACGERRLREHFAFLVAQGHELTDGERSVAVSHGAAVPADADPEDGDGEEL